MTSKPYKKYIILGVVFVLILAIAVIIYMVLDSFNMKNTAQKSKDYAQTTNEYQDVDLGNSFTNLSTGGYVVYTGFTYYYVNNGTIKDSNNNSIYDGKSISGLNAYRGKLYFVDNNKIVSNDLNNEIETIYSSEDKILNLGFANNKMYIVKKGNDNCQLLQSEIDNLNFSNIGNFSASNIIFSPNMNKLSICALNDNSFDVYEMFYGGELTKKYSVNSTAKNVAILEDKVAYSSGNNKLYIYSYSGDRKEITLQNNVSAIANTVNGLFVRYDNNTYNLLDKDTFISHDFKDSLSYDAKFKCLCTIGDNYGVLYTDGNLKLSKLN